jgi:2-isopropylmalate synthase
VNALDRALRKALATAHPELAQVSLCDYKVRILDSKTGTAAKTRVLIESTDGTDSWGTVGVDFNIIDASWEALRESLEYYLLRKKQPRGA